MNPGYLTLLLICISFILVVSGWKEVFLSRVPLKEILLFFMLWVISAQFSIQWRSVELNGVILLLGTVSGWLLIRSNSGFTRVRLLTVGLLLASLHFLLLEFFKLTPVFILFRAELDAAFWISILCVFLLRNPLYQLVCMSIGLILGDTYSLYYHHQELPLYLGSLSFQDQWWFAIVTVRLASTLWKLAGTAYKRLLLKISSFTKK